MTRGRRTLAGDQLEKVGNTDSARASGLASVGSDTILQKTTGPKHKEAAAGKGGNILEGPGAVPADQVSLDPKMPAHSPLSTHLRTWAFQV